MQQQLRVVVVENEPLLLADLSSILRKGGHEVVAECGTAREMVAAIRDHAPDVVVFDVHLGDGDGTSTFRSVSRDHPCAGVAVTGDRSSEAQRNAIENDVLAFILKPVKPEQLLADVRMAHARARQFADNRAVIQTLSTALSDPQGFVARAKAKLAGAPTHLNEVGAHKRLIAIGHEEGVSIARAAEMVLDNEYDIGTYCHRRKKARPPAGRHLATPHHNGDGVE